MTTIAIDGDAAEHGFDPTRLTRIEAHFDRFVDDGRLPGYLVAVARGGKVVHLAAGGKRDIEAGSPVTADTRFRIYSMTKPITSVAAMSLLEEGRFELKDPVSRFIPSFADARVFRSGSVNSPVTEPVIEPVRIWHLLTHTAGLTYGFHHAHVTDALYRQAGFELGAPAGMDLAGACDAWAGLPLRFQPGSSWIYGVSTDVLGRVVEVAAGQSLDTVFEERVFAPLGMTDTAFFTRTEHDRELLAALYVPGPGRQATRWDPIGNEILNEPSMLSGGGGLLSTAGDYHRFTQMLRGRGQLDGVRVLGSRTVDYMMRNHLPGGADLEKFGMSTFAETAFDGVGFGLGFAVVQDPAAGKVITNVGDCSWGGAASTTFWVDPVDDITALFFTQLLPSSTYAIRPQLRVLVQQALVD